MLKVDIYTKVVLTIIAVCLVVLAFRPMFNTPQVVDVKIVGIAGRSLRWGSIPVKVEEWNAGTLPVEVE